MKNIISYAENELDTFAVRPFGGVDSLILSWVANMPVPLEVSTAHNWVGLPLRELFRAEYFPHMFQFIWDKDSSRRLFTALAASPRFRDLQIMGLNEQFDVGMEKQFAAVTFQIRPDLHYVGYRGTDASLVGWKENFNMAFQSPVPSQEEAARYLAKAAGYCPGQIMVGGHSKGGNLAVYAAANVGSDIQARIAKVYSHDGPGFHAATLEQPGFRALVPKLEKTVPQSSVVGLLLDQQPELSVVQSTQTSFLQHDPFTWVVEGTDFLYDQLTAEARFWDRNLDDWLRQLSPQELERFVESLYDILESVNVSDLTAFQAGWQKNIPAVMRAAAQVDPDTRHFLFQTIGDLVAISLKNFPDRFRNDDPDRIPPMPTL